MFFTFFEIFLGFKKVWGKFRTVRYVSKMGVRGRYCSGNSMKRCYQQVYEPLQEKWELAEDAFILHYDLLDWEHSMQLQSKV